MTTTMDMKPHPERHPVQFLDRHGALTFLFAVALQTITAVWWASGQTTITKTLVETVEKQSVQIAALTARGSHPVTTQDVRRLEELVHSNATILARVQGVQEQMSTLIESGLHSHSAPIIKPPPHEIR